MKKRNGFFTAELLVTTTVLSVLLIVVYSQISNALSTYNKNKHFNTTESMYATSNIRSFIKQNELSALKDTVNSVVYVDLTDCSFTTNYDYCRALFDELDVKKVIFTKYNVTNLKKFDYTNDFDSSLKSYIANMTIIDNNDYRIIVELNDSSASSLKVRG